MSITLSALQKQRRDTAANWTAANPTLLAGEIGIESNTNKIKIGDGSTAWASLAYTPWSELSAYPLTNADISASAEIAVSKLADGSARQLLQTAANGTDVEWTSNVDVPGTLDVTGAATFDAGVTIQGDLTVNGTTTNINTQNLVVEDKNIIVGDVATPTDVTADGGGITLKGTTNKTINWVDATDAWTFSEHINIASAREYRIAGTKVLDATSLGSSVVNSSLTSVGTIGTGVWQGSIIGPTYGGTGQTTYTDGQLLIGNSTGNTLSKSTLTAGSGVTITNGSGSITISATGSGGTITNVTGTAPISVTTGTTTPAISIASASTSAAGAVQLTDSTSSTSITTAATPNSVKTAYDLANAALPKAGGTVTGNLEIGTAGSLSFEGATADAFETTIAVVDPTADRTITLPDTTGTVVTTGDTGTVTGTMIASSTVTSTNIVDGTIVNADINASAAIAGTKISPDFGSQNIATTGNVTVNAQGDLRFGDADSSNWVAFQAPSTVSSNVTWTLPSTDGSASQALSTNGSGVLSWATFGTGDVTQTGTQTLTNKTLTDPAIIGTILEDVYTITDGAAFEVDPGNGSVQLITLGASRTPKATNFAAGESVTLMVDDGTAYTLTWTDTTWGTGGVTWVGGTAPTLATTGYTVLQFWKVSTKVYGVRVGSVA